MMLMQYFIVTIGCVQRMSKSSFRLSIPVALLVTAMLVGRVVQASPHIELVEFKDAEVRDAARILATLTGTNVAVTREAGQARVDLLLQNTRLKDAIDMLTRVTGLWYRYNKIGNSYVIMTEKQYQEDIVIYRDDIIKTFTLRHQNVNSAALIIQSLFGDRVRLSLQKENDDFDGLPFDSVDQATVVVRKQDKDDDDSGIADVERTMRKAEQLSVHDPKQNLTSGEIRALGQGERVDAEKAGDALGSKTPIFVATNHMHNLLFVRTSDENALAEIESLIIENDRPTPQVLLEMKIVRISLGDEFKQDFDLSFNDALNLANSPEVTGSSSVGSFSLDDLNVNVGSSSGSSNSGSSGSTSGSSNASSGNADLNALALAMSQLQGNSVTGFGFNSATGGFYEFFSRYVNARLQLLQQNNQAEIIAKPLILASNNRPAKLFLGEEVVIAVSLDTDTAFSNSNDNGDRESETTQTLETERRKVGNTLILLPSINADRTVTIDILQDSSTVDRGGLTFPYYDNKSGEITSVNLDSVQEANVKTVVVAKDGNTIALGGMISEEQSDNQTTIPLLGDVPFIGKLFRTKNTVDKDAQYVMLLTPHILMSPEEAAVKSREITEFDYDTYAEPSTEIARQEFAVSDYVEMMRLAATISSDGLAEIEGGVKEEQINARPIQNLLADGLLVTPVDGWRKNGLYITRLMIENESDELRAIDLPSIPGDWLASSADQLTLAPYRAEGDSTWLYLLSSRPFNTLTRLSR